MSLEQYLEELSDLTRNLNVSQLAALSGLSAAEVRLFDRRWPKIDVGRRREIIGWLIDLAGDNIELDFEAVFRACLRDEDAEVRGRAVAGLWEYEDSSLIPPLIDLLKHDPEPMVRGAAAAALGPFAILVELGRILPADAAAVDEALLTTIDDPSESLGVRGKALEAIGARSTERASAAIRDAYASPYHEMRLSALCAMGRSCDERWLPLLFEALRSPDSEVRFEAVRACGEIEDQQAVLPLITASHDPDLQVRLAAIEALGHIGGILAKQRLRECAQDPDELIQDAALEALDEIMLSERSL